jgi:L-asparagine transporter-like permease
MDKSFKDKLYEYEKNKLNYRANRWTNSTLMSLLVLVFISIYLNVNYKSNILITITVIIFLIYLFYDYKLRKDYGL